MQKGAPKNAVYFDLEYPLLTVPGSYFKFIKLQTLVVVFPG